MSDRTERLIELLRKERVTGIFIRGKSSVRYFSGFTGDDSLLYIDGGRKILITDSRFTLQAREECPECEVLIHKEGLWKAAKTLGIFGTVGIDGTHFSFADQQAIAMQLTHANWKSIELESLRAVKDAEELKCIQQAVMISDEAFRQTLPKIHSGKTELELAALLEYNMRRLGSEETAFTTIVASGPRSALPHATATNRVLVKGDFVTFDFGATYRGYRSDITRTLLVGKGTADWQKGVYDMVLRANLLGEKEVCAGKTGKEIDGVVRAFLDFCGYGEYFIHGLGHGVGLDIHEKPVLNKAGKMPLLPNQVVTVEPGIYIPATGGVRIEDTVVVTEKGCKVLTSVDKQLLTVN